MQENATPATTRGTPSWKFVKSRLSPQIATYTPPEASIASRLSTSCVQDYMLHCAVPRPPPTLGTIGNHGNNSHNEQPLRKHSPVARLVYRQSVRKVVDFSTTHEVEVHDVENRACETQAPGQFLIDSAQRTDDGGDRNPSAQPAFNSTSFGMDDTRLVGAGWDEAHSGLDTSEGIALQPALHEIAQDPIEVACDQPAMALYESLPPRNEPLDSRIPVSQDLSSFLSLHAGNASSEEHSGDASASPPTGDSSRPLEGAQAIASGIAGSEGSGLETSARKLTVQERNRLSAARSNEKGRRALEALKQECAEARAQCQALLAREAKARSVNRKLKEEAARRWMEAALKN